MSRVVVGTVTGTGAAINVGIGFVPRYVKTYNNNDAGSLFPTMEWFKGMAAASGLKTLSIADNGTTSGLSQAKVTSNGISEYAGSGGPVALSGTVAVAVGSAVVTGTSTKFTTECAKGQLVSIGGIKRRIIDIASATSMTVDAPYEAVQTGVTALNENGVSAGFTIGADTDLNVAGEVINYLAIGD